MSRFFRAWYLFLALGLLTFVFAAFVGNVPYDLSSWVALPHNVFYRAGITTRGAVVGLLDRRDLRAESSALRLEVDELRERNRQLSLEVERLREVLAVREDQSPGVVATAPIIGGSSGDVLSRLTIGKGRRQGVARNMPVTVPSGLVGLVTEVAADTAIVRTVTDVESAIGVTVRGKGGQGVARGEIGGRIRVTDYIEIDPIEVGDLVETSSRGGFFPRGVLVGVVEEVLPQNPNELRGTFVVRPAVDLATLLEVVLSAPQ